MEGECTIAVFGLPPWSSTQDLFHRLNLSPLSTLYSIHHLCTAYCFNNKLISPLFSHVFQIRSGGITRGSTFNDFVLPVVLRFSTKLFSLHASTLWNSLPTSIRTAPSVFHFKALLFEHLGNPVIRP